MSRKSVARLEADLRKTLLVIEREADDLWADVLQGRPNDIDGTRFNELFTLAGNAQDQFNEWRRASK